MNRSLYRALLIVSFLGLNAIILFGIGSIWSYFNTGADRASILHVQEELNQVYRPKITWEDTKNEGRPMERQTREAIEKDYLSAWYVRNIALETNSLFGIADYYTDSARLKLHDILDINRKSGTNLKTTTIEHRPKLEFYSEDGKLVVLTDKNVLTYQEVYSAGVPISKGKSIATYQVMLLLEDGFWRIRHMVKIPNENQLEQVQKDLKLESISKIRGVNYYPQQTPWNMYGTSYNKEVVSEDFRTVQELGLNTLRLFVPYEAFGQATIEPQKLNQLEHTLNIAQAFDLKVIITLFDFYGDYGVRDWTLTHRHAEQIVTRLKNHKALLAWDIKNEPDLDFDTRGKEKVLAWLEQMISNMNQWDNSHPVTIGWSNPEAATNLSQKVDFVSFHYYREASGFSKAFQFLRNKVPNRPLVLQEFGYSSYDGIWNAFSGSEKDQATYHQEMQKILKEEHIPFLFWTLYDFKEIPTSVVGKLPWRKARQKYFGILDSDRNPKTSHAIIGKSVKNEKGTANQTVPLSAQPNLKSMP
ncbi:cellulase family glycosylhydrolase [Maribacter sp. 2304DJ31-5]|uniref:cellulase family glycosylhydrolase n=1 Tax=Maribacter sp. 2304DJ31-5 TaxID=3386273 RepID=UPI0039BC4DAF